MTTPTDKPGNVVPFATQEPVPLSTCPEEAPINITFCNNAGDWCGEFIYDRETRKWSFNGEVEESARQFLDFLSSISGENR
jgi:hypothetical protein